MLCLQKKYDPNLVVDLSNLKTKKKKVGVVKPHPSPRFAREDHSHSGPQFSQPAKPEDKQIVVIRKLIPPEKYLHHVSSVPRPIVVGQSAPRPIVVGHSAPRPIVVGHSAPRPIVVGQSAPRPIVVGHSAPRPIVVGHSAPRPIVVGHGIYVGMRECSWGGRS